MTEEIYNDGRTKVNAADFFPEGCDFAPQGVVLVTGGAGFIGSALVETLLAKGCRVRCLDNFSTGFRENIAPFLQNPAFELLEGDLRSENDCRRAVENAEYVLHEAALGSVPRSIADPGTSVAVNVSGTVNLFDAARREGVRRIVYASSSSVYGDDPSPEKVESRTGKVLSPYAASKAACELFAENFGKVYALEIVGLRYFNVFGMRQNPAGAYAAVIPKFARALLAHESPVINGDGTISRDFTFIGNVVNANILALSVPGVAGEVFNVGCGCSFDLNTLFDVLRSALAVYDPEIAGIDAVHGAERPGDVRFSLASTRKAGELLGYVPRFSFEEGIAFTAGYYAGVARTAK